MHALMAPSACARTHVRAVCSFFPLTSCLHEWNYSLDAPPRSPSDYYACVATGGIPSWYANAPLPLPVYQSSCHAGNTPSVIVEYGQCGGQGDQTPPGINPVDNCWAGVSCDQTQGATLYCVRKDNCEWSGKGSGRIMHLQASTWYSGSYMLVSFYRCNLCRCIL